MFLPHPRVKVSIVGSLCDREVASSASNFDSCVWRTVSSQSSHHPQEVLLAQFKIIEKHVKLNKVLDNDGHPPTASVGNETSILNTLKIVLCRPYSTQQHYFFDQLSYVYELITQLDHSTQKRC